ncbi:MAG TPA: LysR family transcriptional regulator [Candidatus Limnocylindrales bacterium]|nr:LysR family transcriptional regulator [Candidatus Limnocylindrales bacterium]
MIADRDLDPRLLRAFVVVAEELHFTRAAARLFVAQQALSRDIRRLEDQLGVVLFDRTTRRVVLTADGRRLVPLARQVLDAQATLVAGMAAGVRPLVVDVVDENTLPARILGAARAASGLAFVARFGGGLGAALPLLAGGQVDVAFGRATGALVGGAGVRLEARRVGDEPVALLVGEDHPLADQPAVGSSAIRGLEIDASVGNEAAPEWTEFALALLADVGAEATPAHPHVVGPAETARHLREHGRPILTFAERSPVPGAVVVPIVDPVPTYPWSMLWRRGFSHPALTALHAAADQPAGDHAAADDQRRHTPD